MTAKKNTSEEEQFNAMQENANSILKNAEKNKELAEQLEKAKSFNKKLDVYCKFYKTKGNKALSEIVGLLKKNIGSYILYSHKKDPDYFLKDKLEFIRFARIDSLALEPDIVSGEYEVKVAVGDGVVISGKKTKDEISDLTLENRANINEISNEAMAFRGSFNLSKNGKGSAIGDLHSFIIGKKNIVKYIGKSNFNRLAEEYLLQDIYRKPETD